MTEKIAEGYSGRRGIEFGESFSRTWQSVQRMGSFGSLKRVDTSSRTINLSSSFRRFET